MLVSMMGAWKEGACVRREMEAVGTRAERARTHKN
jgi:hypothetical protein